MKKKKKKTNIHRVQRSGKRNRISWNVQAERIWQSIKDLVFLSFSLSHSPQSVDTFIYRFCCCVACLFDERERNNSIDHLKDIYSVSILFLITERKTNKKRQSIQQNIDLYMANCSGECAWYLINCSISNNIIYLVAVSTHATKTIDCQLSLNIFICYDNTFDKNTSLACCVPHSFSTRRHRAEGGGKKKKNKNKQTFQSSIDGFL